MRGPCLSGAIHAHMASRRGLTPRSSGQRRWKVPSNRIDPQKRKGGGNEFELISRNDNNLFQITALNFLSCVQSTAGACTDRVGEVIRDLTWLRRKRARPAAMPARGATRGLVVVAAAAQDLSRRLPHVTGHGKQDFLGHRTVKCWGIQIPEEASDFVFSPDVNVIL